MTAIIRVVVTVERSGFGTKPNERSDCKEKTATSSI